jgi:hypothetical protein
MKNCIVLCFIFIFTSLLSAQKTQWLFRLNGIFSGNSIIRSNNEGDIMFDSSFKYNGSFQFKDATITTTNTVNSNTYNLLLSKINPKSIFI